MLHSRLIMCAYPPRYIIHRNSSATGELDILNPDISTPLPPVLYRLLNPTLYRCLIAGNLVNFPKLSESYLSFSKLCLWCFRSTQVHTKDERCEFQVHIFVFIIIILNDFVQNFPQDYFIFRCYKIVYWFRISSFNQLFLLYLFLSVVSLSEKSPQIGSFLY